MVLIFLSLFLFSKDVGFLVVASTKTISNICSYVSSNNIDISFSYAGNVVEDCNIDRFENVDYLGFPLGIVLNKTDSKKRFFECGYKKYVGDLKSKGFFIEAGGFDLAFLNYIPSSYSWIVASVSTEVYQNFYDINDRNLLSFELIKSTQQVLKSSSSLFLLDERIYKNPIDLFLALKNEGIRFLKVSDVFLNLSKSTEIFKNSNYLHEFKNEDINYLSYLSKVFGELSRPESDNLIYSLCDFFDFYPINLDNLDEIYDEIRSLTYDVYFMSSKNIPSFVYDDFLSNNVNTFYIEKTQSSLTYKSDNEIFSVNLTTNNVEFEISFSTYVDNIHIYADMNKRTLQGLTSMIGKKEKISDNNAWEYALIIDNNKVKLYNSTARDYKLIKEFKIHKEENFLKFSIPKEYLKGNLINWCYIVVYWNNDQIKGFFTKISQNIFACSD